MTDPLPDVPPSADAPAPDDAPVRARHDNPVARRFRTALVVQAALRFLIPIAAIPLAPALIPDDVGLLTLLRPGKEVLLLAGGLTRTQGSPGVLVTFLAYLPGMLLSVWGFFALGRAYGRELETGEGPEWLTRVLPPERVVLIQRMLERRGPIVALVGRLVALPPTIVAAAAGAFEVPPRPFLLADAAGAVLSFGMVFGIGLGLGQAYERGGTWLLVGSIVVVVIAAQLGTRWFQAELEKEGRR